MMDNNYPVLFLMGHTASGKTSLAIELRKRLPIEIISVDSALVYSDMNIGTAKPTKDILQKAPHKLIDICDPSDGYSVSKFCEDAFQEILKIISSNRIPLLVGGTMLYFKALLEGLSPLPKSDCAVRTYIEHKAQKIGWPKIYQKLKLIDPESAYRIHPNDLQRLLRALEVFLISGKTLTELQKISGRKLLYNVHQFAIRPFNRTILYHSIEKRFYKMISDGFQEEVEKLFSRSDLHKNMSSIKCIGYRQMWSYLSGEINYNDMIQYGIHATQIFSKRQITWLRNWSNIFWLTGNTMIDVNHIMSVVNKYKDFYSF